MNRKCCANNWVATKKGHIQCLDQKRILQRMWNGRTLMMSAAYHGRNFLIEMFLRLGLSLNSVDSRGYTPLCHAIEGGQIQTVEMLLSSKKIKANLSHKFGAKHTPIMVAARNGQQEILNLLLTTTSIHPDTGDKKGQTALIQAAAYGHLVCTQLLVSQRANVHTMDRRGNTALSLAKKYKHKFMVSYLSQFN